MTPAERTTVLRGTDERLQRDAPTVWRRLRFASDGFPRTSTEVEKSLLEIAGMLEARSRAAWLDATTAIEHEVGHLPDWLPEHFPPGQLDAVMEASVTAIQHCAAVAVEKRAERDAKLAAIRAEKELLPAQAVPVVPVEPTEPPASRKAR